MDRGDFEALIDQIEAYREEQSGAEGTKTKLEKATVVLLAVTVALTFATFFVVWGQLSTAKDAEERQLRAYMVVPDFLVACVDCGDPEPSSTSPMPFRNYIHDRLENNGQTPARRVHVKISWWPVAPQHRLPDDFKFPDISTAPAAYYDSSSDIGRDKTKDGISPIPDADVATFRSAATGVSTLYVYGHVDYCDVFNKPRSTGFCFMYIPHQGEHLPICDRFNGEIPARGHCAP